MITVDKASQQQTGDRTSHNHRKSKEKGKTQKLEQGEEEKKKNQKSKKWDRHPMSATITVPTTALLTDNLRKKRVDDSQDDSAASGTCPGMPAARIGRCDWSGQAM
ncbi:hypothetical protein ASPWEDRAFT_35315 [Aspergillus wentii DTO 134E9]|uniref:Uncharacterized protein n=1 Tax=Aspergillus wentii DTO 134E9 TaxID=1073089 RepID=A0A1L9S3H0_ASPWE|nr:uncharacterized protein ASPWEDRAFT_35315 [Aspergillus wentii DTO 134E9]OJJ41711.1 hypothetical protein ASPWEDRAFT_35315 [Aspergillus wentii DTO 134E9]